MSEDNNVKNYPTVAGLDIGTSKVVLVLGQVTERGIEVLGKGECHHNGVRQGVIVNIEEVSEAIIKAKDEAEVMSGVSIGSVWVSVSGSHVESFDSRGLSIIKNKEVKKEDVDQVIEVASTLFIPSDRKILHVIPKEFKVDSQEGIIDPIGMSGIRIEALVHVITGSTSILQNTKKAVERTGLKVKKMVLQQLASAEAVLSDDEKKMGVGLVDLGGGTSDIITFHKGSVDYVSMIPVGGQNFLQDIAVGLKTTQINAAELLKKQGNVIEDGTGPEDFVEVDSLGGRQSRTVSKQELNRIISARAEETIELIKKEISNHELVPKLGSGMVFTGGLSHLEGFVEMCDFLLDLPVRRAVPSCGGDLKEAMSLPSYATVMGLLQMGAEEVERGHVSNTETREFLSASNSTWKKVKSFFTDMF